MANLITLAEYKEAEGLSNPKDDLRLQTLIPSISELVKTYCGNSLVDYYSTNKVETFSVDWATSVVQLTESPLNTVVSVEERRSYNEAYTTLTLANFDYYVDANTDSIFRTNNGGRTINWATGVGAVKITYTAGYATLPVDLKLAVIDLMTYYFKREHKERRTLGGASIQNSATTSQADNVGFPDHIKRILDLYKTY
tara:strand:- start:1050 stop:1640 length:591 start_codon:yes stop_codon:yes gene_type:complete